MLRLLCALPRVGEVTASEKILTKSVQQEVEDDSALTNKVKAAHTQTNFFLLV